MPHRPLMNWFLSFAAMVQNNTIAQEGGQENNNNIFDHHNKNPTVSCICPSIAGTFETFSVSQIPVQINLSIPMLDETKNEYLCTLSLQNNKTEEGNLIGTNIPIARSYDGNDWERAGGAFVAHWDEWVCDNTHCTTSLHAPGTYVLQNRLIQPDTNVTYTARFLEQATFGTTRTLLADTLQKSNLSSFIEEQFNAPPTFHREYFRKHVNAIWNYHHPNFASTLSPCSSTPKTTTWRRNILNEKDYRKHVKVIQTSTQNDTGWKIIVGENIRAWVSHDLRFRNSTYNFFDGQESFLCSTLGAIRRNILWFRMLDGTCQLALSEDWIIDFPQHFQPPLTLSGTLDPLFMSNTTNKTSSWMPMSPFLPEYMYKGLINPSRCLALPNETLNLPPLFAKTADGQWLIHDPRIVLERNSLEQPLIDGGNSNLLSGRVETCSNVKRNYQNEKYCQTSSTAACQVGSTNVSESEKGTVVCGSPGEVANDMSLGDNWLDMLSMTPPLAEARNVTPDSTPPGLLGKQREFIWSEIVLRSPDQLRQRTAWALSQIFSLQDSVFNRDFNTEPFLQYYDIFVRHAFGNYFDILQDVAYSPLTGQSLTYEGSMSVGHMYLIRNETVYPDENFARELMQLFTIGLTKLNIDGTPVYDEYGKPIRTYDNDDIMSFARAWTGFQYPRQRSNKENFFRTVSRVDPMNINSRLRDHFPKTNLENGYIGDGYPLCVDLPPRHFLKKGAVYRVLGPSPKPELASEVSRTWSIPSTAKMMTIRPNSALYEKLCQPTSLVEGTCNYPGYVVLDRNLNCFGDECLVDTVQVVKVNEVFYEYVRIPCVEQSFYQNTHKVTINNKWQLPVCASADLAIASEACCNPNLVASPSCVYASERTTFATARERCVSIGKDLCGFSRFEQTIDCPNNNDYRWTNESCQLQVKVDSSGRIAIVHDFDGDIDPPTLLQPDTPVFFRAYWEGGDYPKTEKDCSGATCIIYKDSCICNVTASHKVAFLTLPNRKSEIIETLQIGHAPPDSYENGTFIDTQEDEYVYYSKDGKCCSIDTVFEVVDRNGSKRFLKNEISMVLVDGSEFKFRNPVQFNSVMPTEHTVRDAAYETEAVLRHLFEHQNTAPFVAYRLIQRFGISNPSPRYVKVVAEAFRNGLYKNVSIFGNGEYGDLTATIAAVLLDREARSNSIGHCPTYGSLREQILKVISFMRAMEFNSGTPLVELDLMNKKVGQMAHRQPTVFSFFRPEYSSPGQISLAQLVAPEAEILGSGKVVGILNGLFSLIKIGKHNCIFEFSAHPCVKKRPLLDYKPTNPINVEETIEELSVLLTGGRLDSEKQASIFSAAQSEVTTDRALKMIMQLVTTTPEFHSSSRPEAKKVSKPTNSGPKENLLDVSYKAVVHLSLNGGCDSFNVLSPHMTCSPLRSQYQATRKSVALNDTELLTLEGDTTGQPCSTFGLHHGLRNLKQMYDDEDLLFIANVGVLTQPVNLTNYNILTETQLFAHNAMSDEVKRLDPFNTNIGTGVLGRVVDILDAQGYRTGRSSIEASILNLASRSPESQSIVTLDDKGVDPLNIDSPKLGMYMDILNGDLSGKASGVFGETWSKILRESRNQTHELHYLLLNNPTTTNFNKQTSIGNHLSLVAQLIAAREARGVDRDFFYVEMNGYDMHPELTHTLESRLRELDEAVQQFTAEMKALGFWKNVTIVQTSEFGRTMAPNSGGGTDHGWGGNIWIAGGDVKGGRILGEYPSSLDESSMVRGRVIPTTPFDSIFNGIAEWVGVKLSTDLDTILPNRQAFSNLFSSTELFKCNANACTWSR